MFWKLLTAAIFTTTASAEKFKETPLGPILSGDFKLSPQTLVQDETDVWYATSGNELYSSKDLKTWFPTPERFTWLYQQAPRKAIYGIRTNSPTGIFLLKNKEWKKVISGTELAGIDNNGNPMVILDGELFRLEGKEKRWQQVDISENIRKAVEMKNGDLIFTAYTGVYQLKKGEPQASLLPGSPTNMYLICSDGEKAIAVMGGNGSIFSSKDQGKTWTKLTASLSKFPIHPLYLASLNRFAIRVLTETYYLRFQNGEPELVNLKPSVKQPIFFSEDGKKIIDPSTIYDEIVPISVQFSIEGEGKIMVTTANGDLFRILRNQKATKDFNQGEIIGLKAIPAKGYIFEKWVGCNATTATCERHELKESNNSITAVFRKKE